MLDSYTDKKLGKACPVNTTHILFMSKNEPVVSLEQDMKVNGLLG